MDVMPTLLDIAGVEIPEGVEGRSLLPLVTGEDETWRPFVHGECAVVPTLNSGMQYMTDGKRKYIWYPGAGDEHYFDIENDPTEMHNLAESAGHRADIDTWRGLLVEELEGRSEGFVDRGRLNTLGGPTAVAMHWVTPTGGPFAMA